MESAGCVGCQSGSPCGIYYGGDNWCTYCHMVSLSSYSFVINPQNIKVLLKGKSSTINEKQSINEKQYSCYTQIK